MEFFFMHDENTVPMLEDIDFTQKSIIDAIKEVKNNAAPGTDHTFERMCKRAQRTPIYTMETLNEYWSHNTTVEIRSYMSNTKTRFPKKSPCTNGWNGLGCAKLTPVGVAWYLAQTFPVLWVAKPRVHFPCGQRQSIWKHYTSIYFWKPYTSISLVG